MFGNRSRPCAAPQAVGSTIATFAFTLSVVLVAAAIVPVAQQPAFRTAVTAVRLDVLASSGGRPITGLSASDFEVRDNGVVQSVSVLEDSGGVDVALVLDASGSVAGERLASLIRAADALVSDLRPGDRMTVLAFNQDVRRLVPLTGDGAVVREAMRSLSGGGTTALYDALFSGMLLLKGNPRRSLLLAFSDGFDNSSWLSHEQILDGLSRSEVVLYAVRSEPGPGRRGAARQFQLLTRLTDASGGDVLSAGSSQLGDTFSRVLGEFRTRYLLSFVPSGVKTGDGWHTLTLRIMGRPGKLTARNRYYSRGGQ